jgi:hypothetical protein
MTNNNILSIKNSTKENLLHDVNWHLFNRQKEWGVQKKYYLKQITDINVNGLNYYSTVNDHTLVYSTYNTTDSFFYSRDKKPIVYAAILTKLNIDGTIDFTVVPGVSSKSLIVDKYKGVRYLLDHLVESCCGKEPIVTYDYAKYMYKEFCNYYKERARDYVNKEIYVLDNVFTEKNSNIEIDTRITISKAYEYTAIELNIRDIRARKILCMNRVFYEVNGNLNKMLYRTIDDGLDKLNFTKRSKFNTGEIMLKLLVFMEALLENKPLKLRMIGGELFYGKAMQYI